MKTVWYLGQVSIAADVEGGIKPTPIAIECALTIRSLLSLTLRRTHGFLEGMKTTMDLCIDIPNYSTISKRAVKLTSDLGNIRWDRAVHILVDATGLLFLVGRNRC